MRRIDREMGVEFGLYVIDKARFGVLSCVTGKGSLCHPIVHRSGRKCPLFSLCKTGHKGGSAADGTRVCTSFVGDVVVPELYSVEELEDMVKRQADCRGID